MKIPQNKIEQIRDLVNIVDVVGDFVALKRRGRNHFGLCPFHQEDTPSFSVNEEKQIFKCFGCGKGGSAFQFLQEYERITFQEAVMKLANQAGVVIEQADEPTPEEKAHVSLLYDANEFAAEFFERCLSTPSGKKAAEYLRARDFKQETLQKFRVGYAPTEWDSLFKAARKKGFSPTILKDAGLLGFSEQGKQFDRFRDRLMFPIWNIAERIVGFGGRALNDDEPAKYLNSPETVLYKKSKILFGLGQTKTKAREKNQLILVEGYTDFLRLWENGFFNIAATSGTALTLYHAKIISRYVENVVLCLDGDSAGISAALRAGKILQYSGLTTKIVVLPPNEDPDSFLVSSGADGLSDLIQQSKGFFPFFFNRDSDEFQTVSGKAKLIDELLEDIQIIKDNVRRDLTVKTISEHSGISESAIISKINQRNRRKTIRTSQSPAPPTINESFGIKSVTDRAQYELLCLLLYHQNEIGEEIRDTIFSNIFSHPIVAEITNIIFAENIQDPEKLLDLNLSTRSRDLISGLIVEGSGINNPKETLYDCLKALEVDKIDQEIKRVKTQIQQNEKAGKNINHLFVEQIELRNKRKQIEEKYRMNP